MRKTALTAALVALASVTSYATGEDDFATLLRDLTFSDAASKPTASEPSATESLELELNPQQPETDLAPLPTGMRQPVLVESSEFNLQGMPSLPSQSPQVALQSPVTAPVTDEPLSDPQQMIEDPVGAVLPADAFAAPVPATAVGHHHRGVGHGHGDCCEPTVSAHHAVHCRVRTAPQLPSSTLLQYFRSDPCYTNVWDGYRRSCKHHDHLHGTCDCFRKRQSFPCGEVLDCAPADCTNCEAGCDR